MNESVALSSVIVAAISAVAPITRFSLGKIDDKSTWRIDFKADATSQEKMAAIALIQAFNTESTISNNRIKENISKLESSQTNRRIREAILGVDNGWLLKLNTQILDLRRTIL